MRLAALLIALLSTDATLVPRLFQRQAAARARRRNMPPLTGRAGAEQREQLRARHARALSVPLAPAPSAVDWRSVARLHMGVYTLEKIVFASPGGISIPAHLYRPARGQGRVPAVLCLHGHLEGAKSAPVVHATCAALAMRGFVCLAPDGMGSGERSYQGLYHGRQLGYQVLPAGLTLAGLHVQDNRRALDLLASLPEVDPARIGVTGASGGGNQAVNLAILDRRVSACAAIISYGAYAGFLRGPHCACEVVPGVLEYAEQGQTAALIAPRPLMIVAARGDPGAAFRIEDARRNAAIAARLYAAAGAQDRFQLREFAGPHEYTARMRETTVVFFERHLGGRPGAQGMPPPAPLSRREMRALQGGLTDGNRSVPELAAAQAREVLAGFAASGLSWANASSRAVLRQRMVDDVFGGFPDLPPPASRRTGRAVAGPGGEFRVETLETEPGVRLDLLWRKGTAGADPPGVLLVLGPPPPIPAATLGGYRLAALAPRGTGATAWPRARAVDTDDYMLAQGSLVLGRPLLGQWVWDVQRAVQHIARRHPKARIALYGEGLMGSVALLAGALDDRVQAVGAVSTLASYVASEPFHRDWGLVAFVPGLLRLGDVAHIAGALPPRVLAIGSPRQPGGEPLGPAAVADFLQAVGPDRRGLSVEPGERAPAVIARLVGRSRK